MNNIAKTLLTIIISLIVILIILFSTLNIACRLFPTDYLSLIKKHSASYNVDEYLVLSLIKAESNFNKNAVSNASAKGLMQLTDDTFLYCLKKLNLSPEENDIFNPNSNIHAGVWYLSFLIDKYNGDTKNAVAAYNAGATNVDKWLNSPEYSSDSKTLDIIPFRETQQHVRKIFVYKKIYSTLY